MAHSSFSLICHESGEIVSSACHPGWCHGLERDSKSLIPAEIVHDSVAGRVRLRHCGLLSNERLARSVGGALRNLPGVVSVRASSLTGSVLIEYRPPQTVQLLARALEDFVLGDLPIPAAWREPSPLAPKLPQDLPHDRNAAHSWAIDETAARLEVSLATGLSTDEATARLAKYGRNELRRKEPRSITTIAAEQLISLPIAMLGASALLSLATGGIADAVMIAAVVAVNAGIATATERQAERTILGLANYAPQRTAVIRDGSRVMLDPSELTPGDVLLLGRGMLVPADARLLECDDFSVNEAALTGEAAPVHKDAQTVLSPAIGVPDRRNMVFRGTAITGGSGIALVTATGEETEIGRVQKLLGSVQPPETPIQRQLGDVGRELVLVNGLICAGVFGIGMLRGHGVVPTLRTAISLAVAAIPEGLPAVATTTLAVGVQDMRRRSVLVRKIDAVETLGAVEIVGLDKTGTLTENRMATGAVHVDNRFLHLHSGRLILDDESTGAAVVVRQLMEVAALCSEAVVTRAHDGLQIDGTPTEAALVETAIALGVEPVDLRLSAPVLASALRGDGRKRMTTLHQRVDGGRLLCVKGDPVEVLARCTTRQTSAGVKPLDEASRAVIFRANERMAGEALRVLGFAVGKDGGDPRDEQNLIWLGLAGLANPIRPSVGPALRRLHGAGVRPVMITGDQSATAFAIARNLDLNHGGELKVLEAGEIADLQPEVLAAIARQPNVFARVSPVDKLNIVKALQANGRIVAMTGDGVNDGPALRAADVGIAMGGEGSDVAREVADIVLATDDLDGIVEAIRLGRSTYANIRKVLRYLVSTNASETLAMLGAALAGSPDPFSPMQLLWLNLATDALPALALGIEAPESDILQKPPHDPKAPILGRDDFRRILREGAVMGGSALAAYFASGGLKGGARASTITFHGLILAQLLHGISSRSETRGLSAEFERRPNYALYNAIAASVGLQAAAQFVPVLRRFLNLAPLGATDLLGVGAIAVGSSLVNDILSRVDPWDRVSYPRSTISAGSTDDVQRDLYFGIGHGRAS
ncbi:cation-translocating P-type ATPase [Methylocystis echinoides]|uniref:cation-translocating P-type ATPase n=1 Tax=Methylocystis echinoides TaxID=29468 RepID=UPI002492F1E5|nr:HAD-IC family P-type ATPase [Methylocystis echinoides]